MTGQVSSGAAASAPGLELLLTADARITGVSGSLAEAAPGVLLAAGDVLTAHLHPDDGGELLSALTRVAQGAAPAAETLVRLRNGQNCWPVLATLQRAEEGAIAASMVAIREERPAPEQLSEIISKCLSAVLVHRDGRVLFANQAYAALHGYASVAETIARHQVGASIHPADREMVARRMAARLRGENPQSQYEFRLLGPDRDVIWVECLACRIDWSDGPALLAIYHDATARKRAENALRRSERLFSTVFANSPDAMLLSTLDSGRVLDTNDAYLRMRGLRRSQLIGRTGLELGLWSSARERQETVNRLRLAGKLVDEPLQLNSPTGQTLELLASAEVLHLEDEELILYRFVDVTERNRAAPRIRHMAHHDPLTGIANRILFQAEFEKALAASRGFALLSIDLDRFKEVNESFGHQVGDKVLQQVAGRLGALVRDRDTLARLGGDEFAIIQRAPRQPQAAHRLADAASKRLSEPFDVDGRSILIGASIGLAIAPRDGKLASKLLQSADLALFRGKRLARGGVLEFRPEIAQEEEARTRLEHELRRAVSVGEFELHYQPVVALRTRQPAGCEALLRWNHPGRGLVRPDEFIRLAEESGLILPLGRWVLERACRDASLWPEGCKVAVNVSPAQLRRSGLIADVAHALERSGLDPGRLELEVTESVVLQDTQDALAILRQLKKMGVSLALDDFGTGYSSMSALVRFPFDRVKIDRSFVAGLGVRSDCTAVVRAVTGLCASLGLAVTAEGVETEEQASLLLDEGLTEAQGYLFSPARPAEEIRGLLAAAARP